MWVSRFPGPRVCQLRHWRCRGSGGSGRCLWSGYTLYTRPSGALLDPVQRSGTSAGRYLCSQSQVEEVTGLALDRWDRIRKTVVKLSPLHCYFYLESSRPGGNNLVYLSLPHEQGLAGESPPSVFSFDPLVGGTRSTRNSDSLRKL